MDSAAEISGLDSTEISCIETTADTANVVNRSSDSEESADYWTNLLRKNLSKIMATKTSDSQMEDLFSNTLLLIDEEVLHAPRRKSAQASLASAIAAWLYTDLATPLASIIQYEKDIVLLRSMVLDQRRNAIEMATERNAQHTCIHKISVQGPWDEVNDPLSLAGAPSLPMPVEQADPSSLAPFFAHLANDGTHSAGSTSVGHDQGTAGVEPFYNTELLEFEKGVLYADGRVDLCKMVTGPRNIGDLMQSLRTNSFSKHFLLGNISSGQQAPKRSHLSSMSIRMGWRRVDSMTKSKSMTNVWLKRNPLGTASTHDVFRLIIETENLRTLDLDQTELGDEGVADLFELLTTHLTKSPSALRNLYLNACGIGPKACVQIARYLASPNCTIESLYMSNNPIGSALSTLAVGVKSNSTLKRVALQSCGLKDEGVIALTDAIKDHVSMTVLDIGQSYATGDLGMRYNWITDVSIEALAGMIYETDLEYLDISYTPASQASLLKVLEAVSFSDSLLWFHVKPLIVRAKAAISVSARQMYARLHKLVRERLHDNVRKKYGMDYVLFENERKRFLISPSDVRFIDSVYRNRDAAAAARRGLKRLHKWWDEEDETL